MEVISYKITECVKIGMSKVVRQAEEDGMVMVTRGGSTVAMIIPLSVSGYLKFNKRMSEIIERDISFEATPPEIREQAYLLQNLLKLQSDAFLQHKDFPVESRLET